MKPPVCDSYDASTVAKRSAKYIPPRLVRLLWATDVITPAGHRQQRVEFPAHRRRVKSGRLRNPQVDEQLDRARTVSDIRERRAAYEDVWQQVIKDLPSIYLWTPRNIIGLSKKVAGFTLLADELVRLQDVRLAQ